MEELFNYEYVIGNLNSIQFFVQIIGTVVNFIISIVGFGIVMAPIAKNSINGLYAAFPKFWDKVYEVKRAKVSFGKGGFGIESSLTQRAGSNDISKAVGAVSTVLLSLCPNVKAMTDFEDELLDAKAYFLKAIPLMCVTIFIGVFIFLGYPARFAEKFSKFGDGMLTMVLDNVEPMEWIEAIPTEFAMVQLVTDNAQDDASAFENKIAKSVVSSYFTAVNDIKKEQRNDVALQLEGWVIECVEAGTTPFIEYCDSNAYKMSVDSRVVRTGAPNLERVHGKTNNGIVTFAYATPAGTFANEGVTTLDISNWYIQFNVTFTPVAKVKVSTSYASDLTVMAGNFTVNGDNWDIVVSDEVATGYGLYSQSKSRAYVDIDGERTAVNLSISNNKITVRASNGASLSSATKYISDIQGLYYKIDGKTHKIESISVGNSVTFTSDELTWGWGDDPVVLAESQ